MRQQELERQELVKLLNEQKIQLARKKTNKRLFNKKQEFRIVVQ